MSRSDIIKQLDKILEQCDSIGTKIKKGTDSLKVVKIKTRKKLTTNESEV